MRRSIAILIGIGAATLGLLAISVYGEKEVETVLNLFRSKEDFVRRLWTALGNASMSLNRPEIGTTQKTILTGQAIHEASWGLARAARRAFNYWNLTAGTRWKGPVLLGPDTEFATVDDPSTPVDETKVPKNITQLFRVYKNDDEAAIDMLRFIGPDTRYAEAWDALVAGNAMLYAAKLREHGFYTQPLPLYQKGLQDAIKTVVQYLG